MTEAKSRRRGVALERAILEAAWAELSESGYGRFTMEAVAKRAATSKPVIYRRYGSRAELALAAWHSRGPMDPVHADTGSLRGDLLAVFARVARHAGTMLDEMITGVMGEAFKHPEVAELVRQRLTSPNPVTDAIEEAVARACGRGELPPLTLTPRVARLPLDLVRTEVMTWTRPLRPETVAELVDDVYLPLLRGLSLGEQPVPEG